MDPTPEQFRRLARSSPWRWSSLQFLHTAFGPDRTVRRQVRAYLRRPGALRVDEPDGEVILARRDEPRDRSAGYLTRIGWRGESKRHRNRVPMRSAALATPTPDDHGLVLRRPDARDLDFDAPMYQDYAWVAMLDPVELADGERASDGSWNAGVTIDELWPVSHHGREAWGAMVRATRDYEPRCGCCALVLGDALLKGILDVDETFVYADMTEVVLDVETGVCTKVRQFGGSRDGAGHEVRIEAVDIAMGDENFTVSRRRKWW